MKYRIKIVRPVFWPNHIEMEWKFCAIVFSMAEHKMNPLAFWKKHPNLFQIAKLPSLREQFTMYSYLENYQNVAKPQLIEEEVTLSGSFVLNYAARYHEFYLGFDDPFQFNFFNEAFPGFLKNLSPEESLKSLYPLGGSDGLV